MKTAVCVRPHTLATTTTGIFLFALLMAVSALVRIPLFCTPVPMTLQTLVLFLSIAFLGRHAFFAQALYILAGACGIPVFANAGSGSMYFLGITAGYLLGFIAASLIMPRIATPRTLCGWALYFSAAAGIVYACGTGWLAGVNGFSGIHALSAGVIPFVLPETMKIAAASAAAYYMRAPQTH